MRTNHRRVIWAEELGIDLAELRKEHPDHFDSLMMKRKIGRQAQAYWKNDRQLARVEDYAPAPEAEYTPPKRRKSKPKAGKVRRYDFTDAQIEIAKQALIKAGAPAARVKLHHSTKEQLEIIRRSLSGGDSV